MFTGIIQAVGQIKHIQKFATDVRFEINAGILPLDDVKIGDSIAVNGACLTIIALHPPHFSVDVTDHTLQMTTLAGLRVGQPVNLEKCLQPTSYIGGHLVTGHVDGVAELVAKQNAGRALELTWRVPTQLLALIAVKGSIALDGISLTVNNVHNDTLSVTIIPHTSERTTLSELPLGGHVNVEVDLLARYVTRWLAAGQTSAIDKEK